MWDTVLRTTTTDLASRLHKKTRVNCGSDTTTCYLLARVQVGYGAVDYDDGIGEAHDRGAGHDAPKD